MSSKMNGKDFFIGAVVGGVLGALTALVLAPKPGKELRADISGQYEKISGKTVEIAGTVGAKTQEIASVVGAKTQEIAEVVGAKSQEVAKVVGVQTGELVEAAKEVAGVVVSEVKAWKDSRKEVAVALEASPAVEAVAEAVEAAAPVDESKP